MPVSRKRRTKKSEQFRDLRGLSFTAKGLMVVKQIREDGVLKPIKPTSTRSDGSPVLEDGQVYVIATGKVYHPYWCDVVGNKWDNNPKGLLVTLLADVGARQPCHNCTIV